MLDISTVLSKRAPDLVRVNGADDERAADVDAHREEAVRREAEAALPRFARRVRANGKRERQERSEMGALRGKLRRDGPRADVPKE